MKATYRDHLIVPMKHAYAVFRYGTFLCAQPSLEFAKKWIDNKCRAEGDLAGEKVISE